jgi:hypothetical protein
VRERSPAIELVISWQALTRHGQGSRSTANQLIIFGVGANPDPFHDSVFQETERPVMVSNPAMEQSPEPGESRGTSFRSWPILEPAVLAIPLCFRNQEIQFTAAGIPIKLGIPALLLQGAYTLRDLPGQAAGCTESPAWRRTSS